MRNVTLEFTALRNPLAEKHRGFGFVTFELAEDAAQAMDNMDDAEFYGRVLKVNIAKPLKLGEKSRAIWNVDRDEYDAMKGASGGGGFVSCACLGNMQASPTIVDDAFCMVSMTIVVIAVVFR
jgi:RNA recognition motif-containing protein